MTQESYTSRKNQFLRTFDNSLARIKPTLNSWLGEEQAAWFIRDSHQEYEALIPRIPFIGKNNPMLLLLLPTTRYLAVYRGLQRQGRTLEDAGRLVYLLGTEDVRAIPPIARRFIGYLWFSQPFKDRLNKRGIKTHQRLYPGDYLFYYVEGDGTEFDFGVDYLECASCKFLQTEGASELTPYLCATDQPTGELSGWGLTRTMTLFEGFPTCDFRFKRGGETRVTMSPALQAVVEAQLI